MSSVDSPRADIRCPLYGFISLRDWQRDIIDHPVYQRLRRIRQLGMADLVYPSMVHTRFEHSLGVFYMATRLFDSLHARSGDCIREKFNLNEADWERTRRLVQIAALCHDIGHGPLSHLSERLLPVDNRGVPISHEDFSAAILQQQLTDVIDGHPSNRDWDISAAEVATLLAGKELNAVQQFWRRIIVGQVDADRMDYLLRDSLHAGVTYGHFDWPRVVLTTTAVERDDGVLTIGVEERGWHAAETLLLSRYSSFTQIYFHRTLVVFEYFARAALQQMLPTGRLPDLHQLDEFLKWDDWRFWGALANGVGGDWGQRIMDRQPYSVIFSTPEVADDHDRERLVAVEGALGELVAFRSTAPNSAWYDTAEEEILVQLTDTPHRAVPLSHISDAVAALTAYQQTRLYVERNDLEEAQQRLRALNLHRFSDG